MLRLLSFGFALLAAGCIAVEAPAPAQTPIAPLASAAAPALVPEATVVFLPPSMDRAVAPSSSAPPIGVAECDRYIRLVDACPADATVRRGGARRLLEKDGPSFREVARSSTEGRLAVTMACQAALEGLRQNPCR